MELRDVTLRLPEPMIAAMLRLARARDASLGDVVRDALSAELKRAGNAAKTPNRADEQLLGPLRVLLAEAFARATCWQDLNNRLAHKGYALREAGGGLALHSHPDGRRLCKASELGHSYSALMRRFRAPFPGHAHHHIARRILGPARPEEDDDAVIEPF